MALMELVVRDAAEKYVANEVKRKREGEAV